jgi:HPr kinase/phosphorylase
MKQVLLSKLYEDLEDRLRLEPLNDAVSFDITISGPDIGRPGLMLAGFGEGFPSERIQVFGKVEVLYLEHLEVGERLRAFERVLGEQVPCVIVTGGRRLPDALLERATRGHAPLLSTPLSATETVQCLYSYLLGELAPETSMHGTMVDVYGVGILITGRSGIGKSECALDLVERGHRLVADDLIRVIAMPPGILVARSTEPLQNFVEVRGVGLLDIGSTFGIRALRRQKRIEVNVHLTDWDKNVHPDRTGLEERVTEIMDVRVPCLSVPLVAGKNVGVIVEVIALNHILKTYGYDAAQVLNQKLIDRMKKDGKRGFEYRDME